MNPGTAHADAVSDAVLTATRLLMTVSASSIAAVDESITIPQFRVLVVLQSRGPMTFAQLADILGVDPSSARRTVDRLTTAGLVNRTVSTTSRREAVLELTDLGNHVCTEVTRRRRERIADIVDRIPEHERDRLITAAEAFNEAGGEPPATDVHEAWL